MPSKRVMCANPFGVDKHKKIFGTHIVSEDTVLQVQRSQLEFEIVAGQKVCTRCHYKIVEAIAEKNPAPERKLGRPKKRVRESTQSPPATSSKKVKDCSPTTVEAPTSSSDEAQLERQSVSTSESVETSQQSAEACSNESSLCMKSFNSVLPIVSVTPIGNQSPPATSSKNVKDCSPTLVEAPESSFNEVQVDCQSVASSETSESSEPSTEACSDESLCMESFNSVLPIVGVSPFSKKEFKNKKVIRCKYQKMNEALALKFKKILKEKVPENNCFWCKALVDGLVEKYAEARTRREKFQILTCVPDKYSIQEVKNRFKCSDYMAQQASVLKTIHGPFYAPEFETPGPRSLSIEVQQAVERFYLEDSNSKVVGGERNTKVVRTEHGAERVPKRQIVMPLKELYDEFKSEQPSMKIGLTSFSMLRPSYCYWPGPRGHHVTCVCITHENFRVLREAAGKHTNTKEFLKEYLCPGENELCFFGLCSECPLYEKLTQDLQNLSSTLSFNLWTSTDRAELQAITESKEEFISRFTAQIPKIASHHFVTDQQNSFIRNMKANLLNDSSTVVCTVDFGMNYTFIGQNEPQAAHFSRPQCTIHPFVVDGVVNQVEKQKSYIVLSDELNHNSTTFHVFRKVVIDLIKRDFGPCRRIMYVSDGSAAQYKNYKNLANLVSHKNDFQIDAEWHFSSSAHGKSTCDAMTAVVKRATRLHSLKTDKVVQNVQDMFDFCKGNFNSTGRIEIVHVKREVVQTYVMGLETRYARANRFRGIQQIHSMIPMENGHTVALRKYSFSEEPVNFNVFSQVPLLTTLFAAENFIGKFAAIRIESRFSLGIIDSQNDENGTLTVSFMKRYKSANKFCWPQVPKHEEILPGEILMFVDGMTRIDEVFFSLEPSMFQALNSPKRRNLNATLLDCTEIDTSLNQNA